MIEAKIRSFWKNLKHYWIWRIAESDPNYWSEDPIIIQIYENPKEMNVNHDTRIPK